jgi:thiamine biosynthesis lipoprotein
MVNSKTRWISALAGIVIAAVFLFLWEDNPSKTYYLNQGRVFGTYYTIRYEAASDLHDSIQATLAAFDNSLSMFNPRSTLSAINANRDTVTDPLFEAMFAEAGRVYRLSGGAFDITVAPLVNLWGFGLKNRTHVTQAQVDSLLPLIGFDRVQLIDHHVVKADPRIMLDGGAVAKGQACDVVAALLARNGCTNYLVEIGGEIACAGVNSKGHKWRVGITKPEDEVLTTNDQSPTTNTLQAVIEVSDLGMATSGNYRNFYYDGEHKRSHTIDPRTGKPVQHSLLSATVVSSTCMRADALATACMVLGAEKALDMIARAEDAACYLIVAQNDTTVVITSPNWDTALQ